MSSPQVSGISLWSETQGASGSPVVMVHGSWGDHHNWDLVAPRLAETHTVLTYDRRGHSQSQRLTSQGSVHDDVADLAALIEQAGIAPAHVVGNSFGASICLRLAAERPELIRSLIVHEPPLVGLIAEDPAMASILQVFGERIGGVVETLLDEGTYLVSERTMYRILEAADEVRERRAQLRHPTYHKPELLATGPNQTWSWDITRLLGPAKWTYFYLYVILDIYSRYVVGWMIAHRESTELARRLIADTIANQGIAPGTLVLHADRGSSMKSKPVALLLADLGVTKSHSRPHVSNDNPYSEAQFRTLKYWPSFPDRFGCAQDAREFCCRFFPCTTMSTATPGLATSRRRRSITAALSPPTRLAPLPCSWPTPPTLNASCAAYRTPPLFPPRHGSTSHPQARRYFSN